MDGKIVNGKQSEEKKEISRVRRAENILLSHMKSSFRDHLRGLFDYNTTVKASTEWWPLIDSQQRNPSMGGFIAECKGSVVLRQSNSPFLKVVFGPWISFSRLVQTNPNLLHQST